MNFEDFLSESIKLVVDETNERLEEEGKDPIEASDVYVVWSCKTLQNGKALLGTHCGDGLYFESTLNGNTNEIYFDVYKKQSNKSYYYTDKSYYNPRN